VISASRASVKARRDIRFLPLFLFHELLRAHGPLAFDPFVAILDRLVDKD
jgi:hypothetical protein